MSKPDIATEKHIQIMVDAFYERVQEDELLGPVFNDKIDDWSKHLPTMYRFWSSMLLGSATYQGRPFDKHINLPIERAHFDRWVGLFCETVDDHFEGAKAEEAKNRARSIASIFQYKLNLMPDDYLYPNSSGS